MRTSKPISTISYNSLPFLKSKLDELVTNHKICDYMYISHHAEADEKKDHIHLWIKPNTLLDTMDIQSFLHELDPNNPTKPLKCIDFRLTHDTDEWILYCQHFAPYLASKGEAREYHYKKEDFFFHDEDTFDDLYLHAFKGSKWAQNNQILQQLTSGLLSPVDLINNGTVPLNMATQLNSYKYMQTHYNVTDRGEHTNHEEVDEDMPIYSLNDLCVGEALFHFVGIHENYQKFCKANETEEMSIAEWVYNFCLEEFNQYCISTYSFAIRECQ